MAWIESHQSLLRHPKTTIAAEMLGISRVQLIGHLHCLWWWALDISSPDGCLGQGISPKILAEAAEFPIKKAEIFVKVLENCGGQGNGFLENREGIFYLHDWYDYAGKLILKRQEDRDRKRKERNQYSTGQSQGRPQDSRKDVSGTVTLPLPTQPTVTQPTGQGTTTPTPPNPDDVVVVVEKNVFKVYQENFGNLTGEITNQLNAWLDEPIPDTWIIDAMKEAVLKEKRNLSYVRGVLNNWLENGRDTKPPADRPRAGPGAKCNEDPDKYIKGKYGHIVQR